MSNDNARREFMKRVAATAAMTLPAAAVAHAAVGDDLTPRPGKYPSDSIFNILHFGAVADGKTLCTKAIQKTVDECAQAGGGQVLIPAGRFLTGPIFLKSNINVNVLAGAHLLFTTDVDSVPVIEGSWEGLADKTYASMFTGMDLENVFITGQGILDGQGEAWWKLFQTTRKMRVQAGIDGKREIPNPPGAPLKYGRPRTINLYRCKNVLISGITIQNSPAWNIHPVQCENMVIDGVTIHAPEDSPNTDGIDPDSCRNLRIANCTIAVGDDCIIIKSGYAFDPKGVPCENITVTNCVFGHGHCGVGVGSETSGGVKNLTISNCVCNGTLRGLRFKTARGRGRSVENIRASNVVMWNVSEAVVVTMFYTGGDLHVPEPVSQQTPAFRNIHLSEIIAIGSQHAAIIEGLAERPIEELSLSNFVADDAAEGIACTNVKHMIFDNIVVNAHSGPPLSVDNVRELELYRFTTRVPNGGQPVVRFRDVRGAVVQSCVAPEGTGTFLELKGTGNREINLFTNRLTRARHDLEFVDGATESAIVKG
jgi:hypothetical protein